MYRLHVGRVDRKTVQVVFVWLVYGKDHNWSVDSFNIAYSLDIGEDRTVDFEFVSAQLLISCNTSIYTFN